MAVDFNFETVSDVDGIVTRRLTIQPDAEIVSPFVAVQFVLAYDSENIAISERTVLPGISGASARVNPESVSELADSRELRVVAITSEQAAASESLFELVYSHDSELDPAFGLSGLIIDESVLMTEGVQFSAANAEGEEIGDGEAAGDETVSAIVSTMLGSVETDNLYWFTNDRIGISTEAAAVGDEIAEESILYLQVNPTTFLSAQTLLSAGVSELVFGRSDDEYTVQLGFQDGSQSLRSFATETGLLNELADTPAEKPNVVAEVDGVNIGSGVTDLIGREVQASEVSALLPSAVSAFVIYRQRLDDAVALEAANRDGSISGRIIGDADARTVRAVENGSTELVVDLPVATELQLIGLGAETDSAGALQYLFGVIDAEVPAANAETAQWNASLKQAVTKASSSDLIRESFKLDVITPTGQSGNLGGFGLAYAGERDSMIALNLSQVDDLVTVSGYESLVTVGPGQMSVGGSGNAAVYGDTYSQKISGGRGSDFISGGGGSDVLTGGAGEDTFELGFAGTTVITDLAAEDTVQFDLFGVTSLDQLNSRIQSVGAGEAGLRVQFDTFAVELVGYSDLAQIQSGIAF